MISSPFRCWFVTILLILHTCTAHMIEVASGTKDCYFEDLHKDDKITVSYQVSSGTTLEIDFWATDASGMIVYQLMGQDTGTYAYTATADGRFTYCFGNEHVLAGAKSLAFNVHGVVYVPDDGHIQPIEREIMALAAGLRGVKDEQEYLVVRERLHRNTAEATNASVQYWAVVQTLVLFATCAYQIWFLKSFFEVKRII